MYLYKPRDCGLNAVFNHHSWCHLFFNLTILTWRPCQTESLHRYNYLAVPISVCVYYRPDFAYKCGKSTVYCAVSDVWRHHLVQLFFGNQFPKASVTVYINNCEGEKYLTYILIFNFTMRRCNSIIVGADSRHTDDALSALMNEELMADVDISRGKYRILVSVFIFNLLIYVKFSYSLKIMGNSTFVLTCFFDI